MVETVTALVVLLGVAALARRPEGGRKNVARVFGGSEAEAVKAGARWADGVLAARQTSASETPVLALRQLRQAEHALSLAGAKVLLDQLKVAR